MKNSFDGIGDKWTKEGGSGVLIFTKYTLINIFKYLLQNCNVFSKLRL